MICKNDDKYIHKSSNGVYHVQNNHTLDDRGFVALLLL